MDQYMLDIAEKEGSSALLAQLAISTLDTEYVHKIISGKNGLSVLKIPDDHVLLGHSSGGDHRITDPSEYAASVFEKLLDDSKRLGAIPIAMADVIDASATDEKFVRSVGEPLSRLAIENGVAIINGELAKYGPMVNCPCNITGTMLSLVPRNSVLASRVNSVFSNTGTKYFVFDPKGNFVWMNSDGTGTKTLTNSRFGKFNQSVDDNFAMQYDDRGKFGGGAIASFNIVETNGDVPFEEMNQYAIARARSMGCASIMEHADIGNRIIGPHGEKNVYNISGTLVSLVSQKTLENMPRPKGEDFLIAIKGNGRANGFTDRRNLMVKWHGENWHETLGGKYFGEFLTKPSIIFYPIFSELINNGLATSVYHMSGGAFRDKLAKPLAKHGIYVEIGIGQDTPRLFDPDPREATFAAQFNISDAYAKFAMGNEGFVTTSRPQEVLAFLEGNNLEAKVVGRLQNGNIATKGLRLRAFNGDIIDYTQN